MMRAGAKCLVSADSATSRGLMFLRQRSDGTGILIVLTCVSSKTDLHRQVAIDQACRLAALV